MWPIGWRVTTEVRSVEASGDRNYLAHVHGFECEVIVTVAPFDEDVIVVGVNPYPEILLTAEGVVYVIELYCGVIDMSYNSTKVEVSSILFLVS